MPSGKFPSMMATRPRWAWGSVSFLTPDIIANKRSPCNRPPGGRRVALEALLDDLEVPDDRALREQLLDLGQGGTVLVSGDGRLHGLQAVPV